jgi:hypothetical protein
MSGRSPRGTTNPGRDTGVAVALIAISIVSIAVGCSSSPITAEDMVGTWYANHGYGIDILVFRADGTCLRHFESYPESDGSIKTDTSTWVFRSSGTRTYDVRLGPYFDAYPVCYGQYNADNEQQYVVTTNMFVDRSFLGKLRIRISVNSAFYYVKVC